MIIFALMKHSLPQAIHHCYSFFFSFALQVWSRALPSKETCNSQLLLLILTAFNSLSASLLMCQPCLHIWQLVMMLFLILHSKCSWSSGTGCQRASTPHSYGCGHSRDGGNDTWPLTQHINLDGKEGWWPVLHTWSLVTSAGAEGIYQTAGGTQYLKGLLAVHIAFIPACLTAANQSHASSGLLG